MCNSRITFYGKCVFYFALWVWKLGIGFHVQAVHKLAMSMSQPPERWDSRYKLYKAKKFILDRSIKRAKGGKSFSLPGTWDFIWVTLATPPSITTKLHPLKTRAPHLCFPTGYMFKRLGLTADAVQKWVEPFLQAADTGEDGNFYNLAPLPVLSLSCVGLKYDLCQAAPPAPATMPSWHYGLHSLYSPLEL